MLNYMSHSWYIIKDPFILIHYDLDTITETINHLSSRFANKPSDTNPSTFVFEYEVFRYISQVKKTSHGPDNTPYWLFNHGTYPHYNTYC